MIIRDYRESDLEQVNRILEEAFSHTKNNFTSINYHEIVCEKDHVVCGYLLLTKVFNPIRNRYYELVDYVCVLSNYRGFGIGEEMMKYAEEIARKDDAMYLQLTCSASRVAAHHLYEKCGFIKRESDIYRKVLE